MKIVIGSDHAGFELKEALRAFLQELGHSVMDIGTYNQTPVDYPDNAEAVAKVVLESEAERGIF